jgi:Zn-finger protein
MQPTCRLYCIFSFCFLAPTKPANYGGQAEEVKGKEIQTSQFCFIIAKKKLKILFKINLCFLKLISIIHKCP